MMGSAKRRVQIAFLLGRNAEQLEKQLQEAGMELLDETVNQLVVGLNFSFISLYGDFEKSEMELLNDFMQTTVMYKLGSYIKLYCLPKKTL